MLVNKLSWISGKKAPEKVLADLNIKMADFYGKMATRGAYQEMIDEAHTSEGDPVNIITNMMVEYINKERFGNILEIGCGSGKIFKRLRQHGYTGKYTGIEMARQVIDNNKVDLPEASWEVGSVYDYCNAQQEFDCCIAFFVLEHLIYPEKALQKMLGTLVPGGCLLLVFPDFSFSGILPSQKVGVTYGKGAKQKLKQLSFVDALFSYLEARIVAYRLKRVNEQFGDFVINVKPFCLSNECKALTPDVDAIYISNRKEIEKWAHSVNCEVYYPNGFQNSMGYNPFMSIKKVN